MTSIKALNLVVLEYLPQLTWDLDVLDLLVAGVKGLIVDQRQDLLVG